ncbi:hypothetical protein JOC70_000125 [Clostridium pascui]|uniref:hypothetical protein n=1 Tax=Clostridium pascui TaxID=46609 RepID=UPI001958176A|nr:hypothetical protein [Clostridium pascui]MBM7868656.1 hypothetical protein [Clostridium pascui]
MELGDRFRSGREFINKFLWIIGIPIFLNLTQLFSYQFIYKTNYLPITKLFTIKIGIIPAPPSVSFLLEDFPSPLFQYNNIRGLRGIIYEFNLFNVFLMITFILITSFISSGYFSVISAKEESRPGIRDFFINGNENWYKFFILHIIEFIPFALGIVNKRFAFLAIMNFIFMYVEYSIAVDGGRLNDNFKKGISFLFNNLGLTIKMAFYYGVIFSLLNIVVYLLGSLGTLGVITDIIILAYFGAIVNRAVLEVYTLISKYDVI